MKANIAVVDDEPRMVEITAMVLRRAGHDVTEFTQASALLEQHQSQSFDLVLTDLRMPDMDGLTLLAKLKEHHANTPVILMTAFATVQTAVQALRDGADDYLQKPFDNHELRTIVNRALEMTRLQRENRYLRAQVSRAQAPGHMVAESEPMRQVVHTARRVARTQATVLITGASGTGKEVIARALHVHSERVDKPFVAVNCAALSESLLDSELFGHEKGAFTGAHQNHEGLFEQAHGGTLFLDEIAEVPLSFQAKLLRALQEREIRRVGSKRVRKVDVRIIAATNRDLATEVKEGRFREDLFFRLAVIPLRLPTLRERREDIMPLAMHFLQRANVRMGCALEGFSSEVEAHFLRHDWPGNVRELENTVERGVALAQGHKVTHQDLLLPTISTSTWLEEEMDLQTWLDRAAALRIQETLKATNGARAEAARRLGVDRTTLYRMIKKWGLDQA